MDSTVRTILIVLLILMIVGCLPFWPYASGVGYAPSGLLIVLLVIILLVKL